MSTSIIIIFFIAIFIRLFSLIISKRNELKLKYSGAIEYGKRNTILLTISHTIFYIFCFIEGYAKQAQFDILTGLGILVYLFSTIILFIVMSQLNSLWTFKLIIAQNHKLNQGFIFKYFKHPNYFFNVIPELIAIAIICKAWLTIIVLFPVHIVFLSKRILEENKIMKEKFADY